MDIRTEYGIGKPGLNSNLGSLHSTLVNIIRKCRNMNYIETYTMEPIYIYICVYIYIYVCVCVCVCVSTCTYIRILIYIFIYFPLSF